MWRNNNTRTTSPYTSLSGLDSGRFCSNVYGGLSGLGGAFTPFQWKERPLQSGMHVAPALLVPFTQSSVTFGHPVFPYSPSRSRLGLGHFQLSSVNIVPDRCHRTDGKKWRCRNDAVPTSRYCPRHMFRGRKCGRNYAVANTILAASLMPRVGASFSVVHGGHSSNIFTAQRKMESSIVTSLPTQVNRMPVTENNLNGHVLCSPDLSMSSSGPNCLRPLSVIRNQAHPNAAASSLPDLGVTSTESHLSMPTSSIVGNSSLNSREVHDPEPDSIEELCRSLFDYSTNANQVSLPMASFLTPENAALAPFADELNPEQWPWLDSVDRILREFFADNNGITTGNKNLSSADIETEEWDLSPEFA